MNWHYLRLLVLSSAFLLAGCAAWHEASARNADKEYDIKGKIVALAPDNRSVRLDHEDVPGLMRAMQMEFRVEDPKLLAGVKPGDRVQGKLTFRAGGYVITSLEKQEQ